MKETLKRIGAARIEAAFDVAQFATVLAQLPADSSGLRLRKIEGLADLIGPKSHPHRIASELLGNVAQPVRAILFDKTADKNWTLGWHQDRTIAVAERIDVPGYGPWTIKQGIVHVEPPFELIEHMVTLRMHLDPVDERNGPLRIAPGSHRLGRITEDQYAEVLASRGEAICLANGGDIWVYATSILHASSAVEGRQSRRVLQVDYSIGNPATPLVWAGVL